MCVSLKCFNLIWSHICHKVTSSLCRSSYGFDLVKGSSQMLNGGIKPLSCHLFFFFFFVFFFFTLTMQHAGATTLLKCLSTQDWQWPLWNYYSGAWWPKITWGIGGCRVEGWTQPLLWLPSRATLSPSLKVRRSNSWLINADTLSTMQKLDDSLQINHMACLVMSKRAPRWRFMKTV